MGLAEIRDFRIDEPGIEDVVRRVYEGGLVHSSGATAATGVTA
jgi:hypothetical protein